jgi:hypothetical protein
MSTGAWTTFQQDDGTEIAVMYVHGIGFPEEFGVALAEFLGEREVVNGYSNAQAAGQVFNGAEDLAASVVAYFKSMVGTGMVYLYPVGTTGAGDYYYEVRPHDGAVHLTVKGDPDTILYRGLPSKFDPAELPRELG